jgi:hypothetical protein
VLHQDKDFLLLTSEFRIWVLRLIPRSKNAN